MHRSSLLISKFSYTDFLLSFFFFYSVVERELNVPLPLSKIIKKWNNLLQEYKVSILYNIIGVWEPNTGWLIFSFNDLGTRK